MLGKKEDIPICNFGFASKKTLCDKIVKKLKLKENQNKLRQEDLECVPQIINASYPEWPFLLHVLPCEYSGGKIFLIYGGKVYKTVFSGHYIFIAKINNEKNRKQYVISRADTDTKTEFKTTEAEDKPTIFAYTWIFTTKKN